MKAYELIERLSNESEKQAATIASQAARIAELEARVEELETGLRHIANDWPYATPAVPANVARKIARRALLAQKG